MTYPTWPPCRDRNDEGKSPVMVHRLSRRDAQGRTFYHERGVAPEFPRDYIENAITVFVEDGIPGGRASDMLDDAWYFTNSIDHPWTDHPNVTAWVKIELNDQGYPTHRTRHGRRSSMTGDLFELADGRMYRVEGCGFSQVKGREGVNDAKEEDGADS